MDARNVDGLTFGSKIHPCLEEEEEDADDDDDDDERNDFTPHSNKTLLKSGDDSAILLFCFCFCFLEGGGGE